MFFESETCVNTGQLATASPREVGTITQISRYAVSHLYTAGPGTVTVDATSGPSGAVARGPAVGGTKKPAPKPLPATGVPSGLPLGLGLMAGAAAVAGVLRRPRRRRLART